MPEPCPPPPPPPPLPPSSAALTVTAVVVAERLAKRARLSSARPTEAGPASGGGPGYAFALAAGDGSKTGALSLVLAQAVAQAAFLTDQAAEEANPAPCSPVEEGSEAAASAGDVGQKGSKRVKKGPERSSAGKHPEAEAAACAAAGEGQGADEGAGGQGLVPSSTTGGSDSRPGPVSAGATNSQGSGGRPNSSGPQQRQQPVQQPAQEEEGQQAQQQAAGAGVSPEASGALPPPPTPGSQRTPSDAIEEMAQRMGSNIRDRLVLGALIGARCDGRAVPPPTHLPRRQSRCSPLAHVPTSCSHSPLPPMPPMLLAGQGAHAHVWRGTWKGQCPVHYHSTIIPYCSSNW
jgi:hypothetical protein